MCPGDILSFSSVSLCPQSSSGCALRFPLTAKLAVSSCHESRSLEGRGWRVGFCPLCLPFLACSFLSPSQKNGCRALWGDNEGDGLLAVFSVGSCTLQPWAGTSSVCCQQTGKHDSLTTQDRN